MNRPLLTPSLLMKLLLFGLMMLVPMAVYSMYTKTTFIAEWTIMTLLCLQITSTWIYDPISLIFASTVNFIALAVMKFSYEYMADEKFLSRFTILTLLFVLSMNLLIFMPNLIVLLIGWDGLGLISYLLVIYYQNPRSLGAGMLTVLTNRVGDALIISAIALMFSSGHWSPLHIWLHPQAPLTAWLVMIAATTKSAQIPFSSWLPEAMAAPTPVSALVHSSTLVTAGVYLLIRFYPLLSSSPSSLIALLVISATTTLMAGLAALVENDMKKIIALSTLSQLGIMMFSLALSAPLLTFFHLIVHALFKALLFICAGSIIYMHNNNQDLRLFGAMTKKAPLTSLTIIVANSALAGMPFMSGFYSKDLIIEFSSQSAFNGLATFFMFISATLTVAYSLRFIYFTALTPQNSSTTTFPADNFIPHSAVSMMLLSVGAVVGGAALNWALIYPCHSNPMIFLVKISPLIMILGGFLISMPVPLYLLARLPGHRPVIYNFFSSMWFLVPTTSFWPSLPTLLSPAITAYGDHGWNEYIGPQGFSLLAQGVRSFLSQWQNLHFPSAIMVAAFIMSIWLLVF